MAGGPGTIWQKVQADPLRPPTWVPITNVTGPAGPQGKQGNPGTSAGVAQAQSIPPGLPLNGVMAYVPSPQTNSTTTPQSIPGFSFSINANEVWAADFVILGSIGVNSAGIQFQATGPSSPTRVTMLTQGTTTGATAISHDVVNAFSTLGGTYGTNAGSIFVTIHLEIENGSNPGLVQLQFAAAVSSDTATVSHGSYMIARRIA